jgi:protein subunit release factor B
MATYFDADKVRIETVRSEGPGGQNINRRDTKVHAWVKVDDLKLDEDGKKLVREKLAHRVTKRDELEVTNEAGRTQEENRAKALEIMEKLIEEAIKVNPPRVRD